MSCKKGYLVAGSINLMQIACRVYTSAYMLRNRKRKNSWIILYVFDNHAAFLASEIMMDWFILKIIIGERIQRFTNKTNPNNLTLFWVYNFVISFLNITTYNLPNRIESTSSSRISYFLATIHFRLIVKNPQRQWVLLCRLAPSRRSSSEFKRKSCRIYFPYSASLTTVYPSPVEEVMEWRHMCVPLSEINIAGPGVVYPPPKVGIERIYEIGAIRFMDSSLLDNNGNANVR